MKVYEALEILDHCDPLEEVTITFGKAKRIADDWNKNRSRQVMDKNWWLNPTNGAGTPWPKNLDITCYASGGVTKTYDNDRMH